MEKVSKIPETAANILDSEVLVSPSQEWIGISQWFQLDASFLRY